MEETQEVPTAEPIKILNANEVVTYLETIVLYLEACQQDMMKNIEQIKKEKDTND
jgi:hypothetical protein